MPYLDDTHDAWILHADGEYRAPEAGAAGRSAQHELLSALAASVGET
jgi:hypothetical protein